MPNPKISDREFEALFRSKPALEVAEQMGVGLREVYRRRRLIEQKTGSVIPNIESKRRGRAAAGSSGNQDVEVRKVTQQGRVKLEVKDGVVLIGSDHHYWPGDPSPAHRAFCLLAKELKPHIIIANGDVLDGSRISRHPPIGWESRPSLIDEIEACKERLAEQEVAAKGARRIWTLGNHDARFETRLATVAPEYARVHGVHLKDHFPKWTPCWAAWINETLAVKHRFKNGIHATHNNAVQSGMSMATGHLHSAKVTPWTDYTGTRWGVDTGTMADAFGPQFNDYMEDNPRNWRQAFGVFTFRNYRLLQPELVLVVDDRTVDFRGELISV